MTTEATTADEGTTAETGAEQAAATEGTATETAGAATDTGAAGAAASEGPQRPEGLDDKFWDASTGLKVGDLMEHMRELEAKAATRADVPAEGETYDLALPADVQVPEGLTVEIKAEDPLWAEFQNIAREHGVDRAGFGKFVGAFARYQIAAQEAEIAAYVADKTALGANADARITAAKNWLTGNMKAEHAEALADLTVSRAGVEAVEALIRMKSGPVAASPGAAASGANKFEGLHGSSRLEAIRASQAAA